MEKNIASKIENKLNQMDGKEKEAILDNFTEFKSFLADKVAKAENLGLDEEQLAKAENLGLDEEQLAKAAQKIGDYLAKKEEPKNREEKLLQELWKAGNEEEQHKLAHMLVKLVS
ncbi:DUF3243 domain-containing protein [Niallia sp. NCCP-28]|uniref:DUF3243 domain-containing protein n=1 Tax=Niallia sp. NCCP-28 TaxID=2934712 RepID=UPI00208CBB86|nr:DUF3243 domain-containing protein [Niallia sp. NCCP-28]GKU80818.1 hypothetical protein NCCP28_02140 [Niallia sp. NCCP-28]